VVVAEEIGESAVDAAQGRQLGAGFDALPQLDFGHHGLGRTRQNWGWGTQAEINIIRVIRLSGEDSLSPERAQSLFGGKAPGVEPADAWDAVIWMHEAPEPEVVISTRSLTGGEITPAKYAAWLGRLCEHFFRLFCAQKVLAYSLFANNVLL
jgi:hypothetical protein